MAQVLVTNAALRNASEMKMATGRVMLSCFRNLDLNRNLNRSQFLQNSRLRSRLRLRKEIGADGGGRTHTPFRVPDFESSASANSATSALWRRRLSDRNGGSK